MPLVAVTCLAVFRAPESSSDIVFDKESVGSSPGRDTCVLKLHNVDT